jgi:hypothetical protein
MNEVRMGTPLPVVTFLVGFTTLTTLALPVERERGPKEAWQWSDEERVALLFDRASLASRNGMRATSEGVRDSERLEYVIDGRRNPELSHARTNCSIASSPGLIRGKRCATKRAPH